MLPALLDAPRSWLVTVTSRSHRMGRIRWEDPHAERSYRQFAAYAQSKLACLLFAFGLERRLAAAGRDTISLAAHPGFAATDILQRGPRLPVPPVAATRRRAVHPDGGGGEPGVAPSRHRPAGTPDTIRAAHRFQTHGAPVPVPPARRALDEEAQDRLWELSERLTGVEFPL